MSLPVIGHYDKNLWDYDWKIRIQINSKLLFGEHGQKFNCSPEPSENARSCLAASDLAKASSLFPSSYKSFNMFVSFFTADPSNHKTNSMRLMWVLGARRPGFQDGWRNAPSRRARSPRSHAVTVLSPTPRRCGARWRSAPGPPRN